MKHLRRQPSLRGAAKRSAKPIRTASYVVRQMLQEMDARGVSQKSVADALGLTGAAVSNWKAGHCAPDAITVEAFAQVLGYRLVLEKVETGASAL